MQDDQHSWTLLQSLPYIGLVGGLAAAIAAFIQARKAHQGNASILFLSFSERYNSPAMADAMRLLVSWQREVGGDFAKIWEQKRQAGDETAVAVNQARRLVSRFYYDVARLYEAGLINKRLGEALLANNGLHVFYMVCEPLNNARQPDREQKYSSIVKLIRREYGANRLHGPGNECPGPQRGPWWTR